MAKRSNKLIYLLGLLILFPIVVYSEIATLDVSNTHIITSNTNLRRLLVKLDISNIPDNCQIDYAQVSFTNFLPSNTNSVVTLLSASLLINWDLNATWTYPWQTAGGDFDSTHTTRFTITSGAEHGVILDITDFLKSWISNGNYGMILMRPKSEGYGFKTNISGLRNLIANNAEIKVYYTRKEQ